MKYLTFSCLLLTLCALWIPPKNNKQPWTIGLFVTLSLSLIAKVASPLGIIAILILYGLLILYKDTSTLYRALMWLPIVVLSLGIGVGLMPKFHNVLVLYEVQFSPNALPFTLYLNFPKAIIGLMIIGINLERIHTISGWKDVCKQVIYKTPMIVLIIASALMVGYVKFEPKLPQKLGIWMVSNLFFDCLAEEACCRVLFQDFLKLLPFQYSQYIAIILPGLLFGLAHCAGGITYVILATVAGILYGWVYKVTNHIEVSILTHFMLNLTHILLLTYPALR